MALSTRRSSRAGEEKMDSRDVSQDTFPVSRPRRARKGVYPSVTDACAAGQTQKVQES